jgi:hypothetical protein
MSYIDNLDPDAPWNEEEKEVVHRYTIEVVSSIVCSWFTPADILEELQSDDRNEIRGQIECALDDTDLTYTIE